LESPTDEKWSVAVGLKNEAGSTPEEKDGKIKLYPWDIVKKSDKRWPPPGAGNYAGTEAKKWWNWPADQSVIEHFEDPFHISGVMSSLAAAGMSGGQTRLGPLRDSSRSNFGESGEDAEDHLTRPLWSSQWRHRGRSATLIAYLAWPARAAF
jgi:hypothetical protein